MPYRIALTAAALVLAATPLAAQAPPNSGTPTVYSSTIPSIVTPTQDGKVTGLNDAAYRALATIKLANPGTLTEGNVRQLNTAIMADNRVDPVEQDLLEEMVQTGFRNITVTPANPPGPKTPAIVLPVGAFPLPSSVRTFPTVGNAKRAIVGILRPELDLGAAWAQGGPGWIAMIAEYKKNPTQEVRVTNFVAARIAAEWAKSNKDNGFKPYRDLIARLYGFSNSAGGDTPAGRALLYRAAKQHDGTVVDHVPDNLYNWLRPAG